MPLQELREWLTEQDGPGTTWGVKRLSANDTQANGSHQAGPYIPRQFLFALFPVLNDRHTLNPRVTFELATDSHHDVRDVTAIWYNNRFHSQGSSRNETRITGLGGRSSALLDPESTGAIVVFSFWYEDRENMPRCHIWVARDEIEEDIIEERTGPVDPGEWVIYPDLFSSFPQRSDCQLNPQDIPPEWRETFPTGREIIEKAIAIRPDLSADMDDRLIRRRECEFEVYRSIERAVYLPRILEGFTSVDDLLAFSQPISQRRRSRGGRSLELHVKAILREEQLVEEEDFSWQPVVDTNKRPDFLFPSVEAYDDPEFPDSRLRMLAVKSTVKERWRQVLTEARRIGTKHLLTLQHGVSLNQFQEMEEASIQLVVPQRLQPKYPKEIRPRLQSLESFIGEVRALQR